MKATEDDMRWDTCLVVATHAILLLLLFGVVYFLAPLPSNLLSEIGGPLPLSGRLLIGTGALWKHPIIVSLLAVGFLAADGRIYPVICRSRGKKAATIWAIGVAVCITTAIVWYAVLSRLFLNVMVEWKAT